MNILFSFVLFVIITKIKCHQVANEKVGDKDRKADEKINSIEANIDRRFWDDLDDYEWHVAHLRGAEFDGRRHCMDRTFTDKVKRYRKMLKNDGARIEYVSADPIPVNLTDITRDTCKVDNQDAKYDLNESEVAPVSHLNTTNDNVNILPTTTPSDKTFLNTTVTMKAEDTTPSIDHKATTVKSKIKPIIPKKNKKPENDTLEKTRRASDYMFSSVEYYDESIEFNFDTCPDAVEVITLELDQIRSYDLECEKIVEWRSLD